MESQTVPSLSGGGVGKKEWTVVMREEKKISKVKEESCPLINPGFTQPQLQELQHQTLIHRHIAAGLPVPFHLVLPIWKSVASSLGSSPFAIFKQFPSCCSPQGLAYRHVMESDPGRCRRTDGKKWRCSKNVVADQKYCERHIHRGRQRSRKLVEASDVASTSYPTTTIPKKSKVKSPPPQPPPQNPSSSLLGLQLMTPSDNVNRGSSTTTTSNLSNKRVSYVTSPYIAANTNSGTITSAIATNNSSPVLTSTKSSQNVGRYMGEMCYGNASSTNKNISVGGILSPALGFSPKSVLQVVCRNGLGIDIQNGVEREPGRCRRTDGKKWRCRRDVIPDQKYCARHMHRGVKKPAKVIEPITSSADTNTVPLPLATATATATARSCRTDRPMLNTNLSISIPTSPPPTCKDEKSESGNSSDTTITDTTISAYAVGKVPS